MKINVKLIDGTEKEIEIKQFMGGIERSNIMDKAIEYEQIGTILKGKIKAGLLMTEVVKNALPVGFDINTLTIESFDEIFSKYEKYFNLDQKKK